MYCKYSAQYIQYTTGQCTVYTVQCTVCTVQYSGQYVQYSAQYSMYNTVQCWINKNKESNLRKNNITGKQSSSWNYIHLSYTPRIENISIITESTIPSTLIFQDSNPSVGPLFKYCIFAYGLEFAEISMCVTPRSQSYFVKG